MISTASLFTLLLLHLVIVCTPLPEGSPNKRQARYMLPSQQHESYSIDVSMASSLKEEPTTRFSDWHIINSAEESEKGQEQPQQSVFLQSYDENSDWKVQLAYLPESSVSALQCDAIRVPAYTELLQIYGVVEEKRDAQRRESLLGYNVELNNEFEALFINLFPTDNPRNALICPDVYKQSMLKTASVCANRLGKYVQSMLDVISAYYVPMIRQQEIPTYQEEKRIIYKATKIFQAINDLYQLDMNAPIWDALFYHLISCLEVLGTKQKMSKGKRFVRWITCNNVQQHETLVSMLVESKQDLFGLFTVPYYLTLGIRLYSHEDAYKWPNYLCEASENPNTLLLDQNSLFTLVNVGIAELMLRDKEFLLKVSDCASVEIACHFNSWLQQLSETVQIDWLIGKISSYGESIPKFKHE